MTRSPESQSAAHSVAHLTATMRDTIAALVERSGGMTCDEIEIALGFSHQTASARVSEMARAGRLVKAGTRPTRSGRAAAVWVVRVRSMADAVQIGLGL